MPSTSPPSSKAAPPTTTMKTTALRHLPRVRLLASFVPIEIEDHIFKLAGPLTSWLCRSVPRRKLRHPQQHHEEHAKNDSGDEDVESVLGSADRRLLWRDALSQHHASIFDLPKHDPSVEDWCLITSRDFYEHCCSIILPTYSTTDRSAEDYEEGARIPYNGRFSWESEQPAHAILHVALRNNWHSEFTPCADIQHRRWVLFRNVRWRLIMSVAHGHAAHLHSIIHSSHFRLHMLGSMMGPGNVAVRNLFELAAMCGQLEPIQVILKMWPTVLDRAGDFGDEGWGNWNGVMAAGMRSGSLDVVRYIHTTHLSPTTVISLDAAARYGHLQVLSYINNHVPASLTTLTPSAFAFASANGHADVVRWIHVHRRDVMLEPLAVVEAAARGHVDVVRFLVCEREEVRSVGMTRRALIAARMSGESDVVRCLKEFGVGVPLLRSDPEFDWLDEY